jgi:hypothetical protein
MNWGNRLKLGKSSAFVKTALRRLPLTEAAFEADFYLDTASSGKPGERWTGMVIGREFGDLLAMEEACSGPPTVNDLATLLAHAMRRPLKGGDRQRPRTLYLRDRPQWQELLPHLRQLRIEVVLSEDLPAFDDTVLDWMQQDKAKTRLSADEIKEALRQPFPQRRPDRVPEAMSPRARTKTRAFDELYPNIAWWVQGGGWVELGRDECRRSLVRVLDIGGMLWEGREEYDSVGTAMDEAEAFIAQWRKENGY